MIFQLLSEILTSIKEKNIFHKSTSKLLNIDVNNLRLELSHLQEYLLSVIKRAKRMREIENNNFEKNEQSLMDLYIKISLLMRVHDKMIMLMMITLKSY